MPDEPFERLLAPAPGRWQVCVLDDVGQGWDRAADRIVPAASMIKVPILFAALLAVADGGLPLDQPCRLDGPRVGGAGALSLLPTVRELTVRELLTLMIAQSDNDATNAVVDLLGAGRVNDYIHARLGAQRTALRRRMMDATAQAAGLENTTTAAELAAMLHQLRAGDLLPPALTAVALDILAAQQFREGLPAFLPPDVRSASKTGELPGIRHDGAILERADRWVVIVTLVTGLLDGERDRGTAALGHLAAIGEYVASLLDADP
jgi:beta-lactamase class A